MIKRLIFDVDSTLIVGVSFLPYIESTLKKYDLYSEENMKKVFYAIATYEDNYNCYTKENYRRHLSDNLGFEIEEGWIDSLFENIKDCVPPENPKLNRAIEELSKHYEMVLLTNFFGESQMNRLNTMGIGKYFQEYYGEELIKPNKEIYHKACGSHNTEECVMIGDNLALDVEAALKEGLHAIFVNTKKADITGISVPIVDKVEDIDRDLIEKLEA